MSDNKEKSSEKSSYSVNYGNLHVKINTTISQTRKDNGEKDTYIHRNWEVTDKDKK